MRILLNILLGLVTLFLVQISLSQLVICFTDPTISQLQQISIAQANTLIDNADKVKVIDEFEERLAIITVDNVRYAITLEGTRVEEVLSKHPDKNIEFARSDSWWFTNDLTGKAIALGLFLGIFMLLHQLVCQVKAIRRILLGTKASAAP